MRDAEGDTRKIGAKKLRAQIEGELKVASGFPKCPEHIQGLARKHWKYYEAELTALGLCKRSDVGTFEAFCMAYESMVTAKQDLARLGQTIEFKEMVDGQLVVLSVKKNPSYDIFRDSSRLYAMLAQQFGVTPVSRTKIHLEKPDTANDDLMAILMAPRPPRVKPQEEQVQ
jgi:P27 family predicted phage terminase small subunit